MFSKPVVVLLKLEELLELKLEELLKLKLEEMLKLKLKLEELLKLLERALGIEAFALVGAGSDALFPPPPHAESVVVNDMKTTIVKQRKYVGRIEIDASIVVIPLNKSLLLNEFVKLFFQGLFHCSALLRLKALLRDIACILLLNGIQI